MAKSFSIGIGIPIWKTPVQGPARMHRNDLIFFHNWIPGRSTVPLRNFFLFRFKDNHHHNDGDMADENLHFDRWLCFAKMQVYIQISVSYFTVSVDYFAEFSVFKRKKLKSAKIHYKLSAGICWQSNWKRRIRVMNILFENWIIRDTVFQFPPSFRRICFICLKMNQRNA